MADLYENLLESLECPVCKNYMAPPIRQCATGHSICQSCKTKLTECPQCKNQFSDSRNFTLEALASKMQYPCINHSDGCQKKLTLEEKENHEIKCSYKKFKCAMERCTWAGKVDDIFEHWASKKMKSKTYQAFNACHTKAKSELYYANLVEAHDHLFWFKCKIDKGKIYWAVQFIGCSEEATSFNYEIEVMQSRQNIRPRIRFTDNCQAIDIENNDLFKEGVCITTSIDCLGRFIGKDLTITYYLRVQKSENTEENDTGNHSRENQRLRWPKRVFSKQRSRSKGAASYADGKNS